MLVIRADGLMFEVAQDPDLTPLQSAIRLLCSQAPVTVATNGTVEVCEDGGWVPYTIAEILTDG